jgi:thiol-disulfide isomerase/thioredoxin
MKYLSVLIISTAILSFVSCTSKETTSTEKLPEKLVDRIQLVDMDGNDIDLAQYRGKTIFLNYWATWCKPCIAEMPDIDECAKILANEDFVFLAASDEKIDKISSFLKDSDYSFTIVHSKRSVFDMDIMALPTTMIINKDGEIVYNEVGARKWNSEAELNKLRSYASE